MGNLFWIPNSPIKQQTIQSAEAPSLMNNGVPTFAGWGVMSVFRRFNHFLVGVRDRQKMHPSRFGNHIYAASTEGNVQTAFVEVTAQNPYPVSQGVNNRSKVMAEVPFIGNFVIIGVTRDSTGSPLGGCRVELYGTATDLKFAEAISDGSGNFTFKTCFNDSRQFYIVAYKSGYPDVAGTTINEIQSVHP